MPEFLRAKDRGAGASFLVRVPFRLPRQYSADTDDLLRNGHRLPQLAP